jgi:hypothetical protein
MSDWHTRRARREPHRIRQPNFRIKFACVIVVLLSFRVCVQQDKVAGSSPKSSRAARWVALASYCVRPGVYHRTATVAAAPPCGLPCAVAEAVTGFTGTATGASSGLKWNPGDGVESLPDVVTSRGFASPSAVSSSCNRSRDAQRPTAYHP